MQKKIHIQCLRDQTSVATSPFLRSHPYLLSLQPRSLEQRNLRKRQSLPHYNSGHFPQGSPPFLGFRDVASSLQPRPTSQGCWGELGQGRIKVVDVVFGISRLRLPHKASSGFREKPHKIPLKCKDIVLDKVISAVQY